MKTPVSTFLCPSDSTSTQEPGTAYALAKGNIAANWGNSHYYQDFPDYPGIGPNPFNGPSGEVWFTGAPFSFNKTTTLADFLDGTSGTVVFGEVILRKNRSVGDNNFYAAYDRRGDFWADDYNSSIFSTYTTPNAKLPDQVGLTIHCGANDRREPPCNHLPPSFNGARSRHSGGVHVVLGDGSARFVKDTVKREVWRALSSPAGSEVVSASDW